MLRLRFDNQSVEWVNDNFECNISFIHHAIHNLELILKEDKYLYFRDLVKVLGLDPLQYKSTLGWDEKHSDFKYCYQLSEDNDYIDILINPYDLSLDSETDLQFGGQDTLMSAT